ncbi:unnamed protein product [Effrenium voratum]|nr:unnamed protein product [Effrenium voratum]
MDAYQTGRRIFHEQTTEFKGHGTHQQLLGGRTIRASVVPRMPLLNAYLDAAAAHPEAPDPRVCENSSLLVPMSGLLVMFLILHGKAVMELFRSDVMKFSRNRHASLVLEKCLEISAFGPQAPGLVEARAELMAAFLSTAKSASPPLLQIMLDRFGNYIVQRVIETSMGAEKEEARSDGVMENHGCSSAARGCHTWLKDRTWAIRTIAELQLTQGVCWAKGHERDAADSGRNFAEERARPGRLELQVPGHGVGRAKGKGIRGLWIDAARRLQAVHGGYLLVGPRSWRQEGGQATISAVEEGWVISDESGARVRGSGDAPQLAFRWQILEDGGWHDAARFRVATYCAQVVNVDSQECLQHSAVSVQNVLLRPEKVTHVELANEEVETRAAPTEPSAESRPGSPDDVQRSQSWDNSLQGSVHMPQDLRDRVTMEVHRLLCRAQMEVAVSQVDLDVLVEECCHSLVIMCHGPIDDQLLQREVLRVVLRGWERARLHDSPYSSPLTRQTHTRGVGRLQSEEGPVSQAALHVEEPAECQSQVMIGCQVLPCRSAPGGNEATDGCQIS